MISKPDSPAAGLRQRKQQRQRAEILANAIALFREHGFEAVTVRQVAARCEISEATFFNYFATKETLLCEWGGGMVEAAFAAAEAEHAGEGLRRQIRAVVEEIARRVAADRQLMTEAWRRARLAPECGGRGRPAPAADAIAGAWIERACARGEVRGDVGAAELAALLRGVLETTLARHLADAEEGAGTGSESLARRLRRATDLLLDGFRKRNERVRAKASSSPAATVSR